MRLYHWAKVLSIPPKSLVCSSPPVKGHHGFKPVRGLVNETPWRSESIYPPLGSSGGAFLRWRRLEGGTSAPADASQVCPAPPHQSPLRNQVPQALITSPPTRAARRDRRHRRKAPPAADPSEHPRNAVSRNSVSQRVVEAPGIEPSRSEGRERRCSEKQALYRLNASFDAPPRESFSVRFRPCRGTVWGTS